MRINYKYFCLLLIGLLAFQSAYGQNEITDKNTHNFSVNESDLRIENLKEQVKDLFEAYDKCDVGKYIELSHPKNLKKENSNEMNFVELTQYIFESNSEAHKFSLSSVANPKEIIEINNQLFGIVPFKLEVIRVPEKNEFVKLGTIIGISEDNGESWKFVNGLVLNKLFPDIAGIVPIPNEKRFLNGIEQ